MSLINTNLSVYSQLLQPDSSADVWFDGFNFFDSTGITLTGSLAPHYSGTEGSYVCNSLKPNAVSLPDSIQYVVPDKTRLYLTEALDWRLFVFDVLWRCGGLRLDYSGVQTIVSGGVLPPRDAYTGSSGYGCEIWLQCYSGAHYTNSNLSVIYYDVSGTLCTGNLYKSSADNKRLSPFIQNGSSGTGVSSIVSFTSDSGNIDNIYQLLIIKPVMTIPNYNLGPFENEFVKNASFTGLDPSGYYDIAFVPYSSTGYYNLRDV